MRIGFFLFTSFLFAPFSFAAAPAISISWTPSTVYVGETSTLQWTVTGATSCVDQNGSSAGFSMNWTSSPRTSAGTQTKTLTCTGPGGTTTKGASLTVLPLPSPPSISISWSPSTVYVGQTSTLRWSVSGADSCVDQSGASAGFSMNWTSSPRTSAGTQTKSLTCTNRGGSTSRGATLTVLALPSPPSVSSNFNASQIIVGQTTTFSWSSSGASSCSVDGGTVGISGSRNYTPGVGTFSKTVTCSNIGGSRSSSSSIGVVPLPPNVSAGFSPSLISLGETAWLNWSSTGATGCNIDGISYSTSGSLAITPNAIGGVSKTVSCSGVGGSSSSSPGLSVSPPPLPTVSVKWTPSSVEEGEISRLSWTIENATHCVDGISGEIMQPQSGYWDSTPRTLNTSKSIECYNQLPAYSSQASATLVVTPPIPQISVSWNPSSVPMGKTSTLTWSISNATHCTDTINGELVLPEGGVWVSTPRTENTTKSIQCYNKQPEFSSQASDTLTVTAPLVPKVSVWWEPQIVPDGGVSRLNWTIQDATNCVDVTSGEFVEPVTGFWDSTPRTTDTTKSIECYNYLPENKVQSSSTVFVRNPPTVAAVWEPAVITVGSTSTLSWIIENATHCKDVDTNEIITPENGIHTSSVIHTPGDVIKNIECYNEDPLNTSVSSATLTVEPLSAPDNLRVSQQ